MAKQYAAHPEIEVFNLGLAPQKGKSTFQYNHSHPAYSGILKREYPSDSDRVEEITIQTDTLDNVVAALDNLAGISLIKIDVEGGEFGVLQGATQTISNYKPLVVFEHGLGASDFYNTKPKDIFNYFQSLNMNIQTMKNWLKKNQQAFTLADFKKQFYDKLNYYFIAYPAN